MKPTLKLPIVIVLFGITLVFAQAPSSTEKKPQQAAARLGPAEIDTDTQGIDFGPYLTRVVQDIKHNWYQLIPEAAMPPQLRNGKVKIEFAITENGQIAGMRYVSGSGDVALDRAAYGAINGSNPFPSLPHGFYGALRLRFTFLYNPPSTGKRPSLAGISPPRLQVLAGTSVQFVSILNEITNPTQFPISWSVVGQGCTGAACGTISDNGTYTAPPTVPENPTITVRATAKANLGEAAAVVTILPPEPSQKNGQH